MKKLPVLIGYRQNCCPQQIHLAAPSWQLRHRDQEQQQQQLQQSTNLYCSTAFDKI